MRVGKDKSEARREQVGRAYLQSIFRDDMTWQMRGIADKASIVS